MKSRFGRKNRVKTGRTPPPVIYKSKTANRVQLKRGNSYSVSDAVSIGSAYQNMHIPAYRPKPGTKNSPCLPCDVVEKKSVINPVVFNSGASNMSNNAFNSGASNNAFNSGASNNAFNSGASNNAFNSGGSNNAFNSGGSNNAFNSGASKEGEMFRVDQNNPTRRSGSPQVPPPTRRSGSPQVAPAFDSSCSQVSQISNTSNKSNASTSSTASQHDIMVQKYGLPQTTEHITVFDSSGSRIFASSANENNGMNTVPNLAMPKPRGNELEPCDCETLEPADVQRMTNANRQGGQKPNPAAARYAYWSGASSSSMNSTSNFSSMNTSSSSNSSTLNIMIPIYDKTASSNSQPPRTGGETPPAVTRQTNRRPSYGIVEPANDEPFSSNSSAPDNFKPTYGRRRAGSDPVIRANRKRVFSPDAGLRYRSSRTNALRRANTPGGAPSSNHAGGAKYSFTAPPNNLGTAAAGPPVNRNTQPVNRNTQPINRNTQPVNRNTQQPMTKPTSSGRRNSPPRTNLQGPGGRKRITIKTEVIDVLGADRGRNRRASPRQPPRPQPARPPQTTNRGRTRERRLPLGQPLGGPSLRGSGGRPSGHKRANTVGARPSTGGLSKYLPFLKRRRSDRGRPRSRSRSHSPGRKGPRTIALSPTRGEGITYIKVDPAIPSMDKILFDHGHPHGVYIGNLRAASSKELCEQNSIKGSINMSRKRIEMNPGIAYFVFPIGDTPDQDIFSLFEKSYDLLDENLKKGNVLVNCNMGISRSTTIVMAYMMKKTGLSHLQCLEICRKYRACCNPNPGFMDQLEDWHYHLKSLRKTEPPAPKPPTKPAPAPALHFYDDAEIIVEGSIVTIPNFVNPNTQVAGQWIGQPVTTTQPISSQPYFPIQPTPASLGLSTTQPRYRSESDPPTLDSTIRLKQSGSPRPRSSSWDAQWTSEAVADVPTLPTLSSVQRGNNNSQGQGVVLMAEDNPLGTSGRSSRRSLPFRRKISSDLAQNNNNSGFTSRTLL